MQVYINYFLLSLLAIGFDVFELKWFADKDKVRVSSYLGYIKDAKPRAINSIIFRATITTIRKDS